MLYTDGIHLITDQKDQKELHEFAAAIGLKRHYFHNPRGKCRPHYDLITKANNEIVLPNGIVATTHVSQSDWVTIKPSKELVKKLIIAHGK